MTEAIRGLVAGAALCALLCVLAAGAAALVGRFVRAKCAGLRRERGWAAVLAVALLAAAATIYGGGKGGGSGDGGGTSGDGGSETPVTPDPSGGETDPSGGETDPSGGEADPSGGNADDDPTEDPVAAYALYDAVDGDIDTGAATVWDGWLWDGDAVAGVVQVKVAKAAKNGTAKVTLNVTEVGKRKAATKLALGATNRVAQATAADGRAVTLAFGDVELGGSYGDFRIEGTCNRFVSKAAAEKSAAADVLAALPKAVNAAWPGASGAWNTLAVSVGAKGKAKAAGTVDGAKVSATGQLIIGEAWCAVPVVYAKKGVTVAAVLWVKRDGSGVAVQGLGTDAVARPQATPGARLTFALDALPTVSGATVLTNFLGDITFTGGAKWAFDKAGQIKKTADGFVDTKASANPQGLKLTYTAKNGTFKGSFKVYADANGALRKYTAAVTGAMVGGTGYGTATVRGGGGPVGVTICPAAAGNE